MRNPTVRSPVRAARKEDLEDRDIQTMAAPERGRWLLWLAGLVVFGLFGAVVWYAYVEGLAGLGGEPPLVRAEAGPYKRVPDDRGGLDVANQSASVIDVFRPPSEQPQAEALPPPPQPTPPLDPTEEDRRLAAPPDAPDPATLPPPRAEPAPAPEPPRELATPTPDPVPLPPPAAAEAAPGEPPAAPAPAPAAEEPPALAADTEEAPVVPRGGWIPAPRPTPPGQVAQAPRVPERRAPPPALEAREPPRVVVPRPEPPPRQVAAVPPPRPERPPQAAPRRPPEREAQPRRSPPPPPRPAAGVEPPQPLVPPAPAAPPAPARSSAYRLQLLALRSEGAMGQAWSQLRQRYPTVLSDLSPSIERIATVSGTMYRLQAGPFASREAASDACAAIQSQGGQCFVVGSAE